MKLNTKFKLLPLLMISILVSCNESSSNSVHDVVAEMEQETVNEAVIDSNSIEIESNIPTDPILFANMVAGKIESKSFEDWSSFSNQKIFFSPYAYVDTSSIVKISTDELDEVFASGNKQVWGVQDGTGDPIKLTFDEYLDRFINDFSLMDTSEVSYMLVKKPKTYGNEVHNIQELYPEAIFVEVHKSADDDMGMNWRSLILVLQNDNGELKLLGIVHNEWTI